MKRLAIGLMAVALLASWTVPEPASAQRRVLGGGEDGEEEDDEKAAAARKKKAEQAAAKAKAKAEKAEADRAAKDAAEDAATIAAEKAAEAAEKKKEEDAVKAAAAKEAAIEKKKAGNLKSRLKQAKRRRRYFREDGAIRVTMGVEPGAPKPGGLEEVKLEIVRKLEVAHPRFGFLEPLTKLRLVATVTAPSARGEPEATRYKIHNLGAPGQFGFHYTPTAEGEHLVSVKGTTKKGDAISFEFPLHVGVWPPPDLDDEDKALEKALNVGTGGGGGRRVMGGGR